jgi:hypothetical protein
MFKVGDKVLYLLAKEKAPEFVFGVVMGFEDSYQGCCWVYFNQEMKDEFLQVTEDSLRPDTPLNRTLYLPKEMWYI